MLASPDYIVTRASPEDIPFLSSIELAAAALLMGHAPATVLQETTNDAEFEHAQKHGRLWVARTNDIPVGFAQAEILEPTAGHLKEVDVHPDHVRRGLGSELVIRVCEWAHAEGHGSLTLTTFRDVPFNLPFYARLGFEVLPVEELSPALRLIMIDEARRGLDPARRVAMRRGLDGFHRNTCRSVSLHNDGLHKLEEPPESRG